MFHFIGLIIETFNLYYLFQGEIFNLYLKSVGFLSLHLNDYYISSLILLVLWSLQLRVIG